MEFGLQHEQSKAGFSLVEMLITAALIALIFGGLFSAVQSMIVLIGNSKAKAGATALVNERMEYIRSLSYNSVGTTGAPPYGAIPQTRTVVLNGVSYIEEVLIRYIDDDADGVGYGTDVNGVIEDYKQVEVTYSWLYKNSTSSVSLVSTVVPVGIETSVGGGSLRVNIFDGSVLPLSNIPVTVTNDTLPTTTNTTQNTDVNGQLLISGLPAGANYSIWTTKAGYSADGTYDATTTNPNPKTRPFTITESAVSTMNFQIDLLGDLSVEFVGIPTKNSFLDTFADDSLVFSYGSTTRNTGSIVLLDIAGFYENSGSVLSTTTTPLTIESWYSLNFTASTSASTTARVSVYYDDGSELVLIPDGDLSGNSVGFVSSPVDLQGLDISTYDTLALSAALETIDTTYTPQLHDWELAYIESEVGLPGVSVNLLGSKTIGTDGSGLSVYKFENNYLSDTNGEVDIPGIEFDAYTLTVAGGYDIIEMCPSNPVALLPGTSETVSYILGSLSGPFLHVHVTDPAGDSVAGASVRLQNTGYDETNTTSLCGQTYFNGGGLYNDDGYTLSVSATGYNTALLGSTTVSATASSTVVLTPS